MKLFRFVGPSATPVPYMAALLLLVGLAFTAEPRGGGEELELRGDFVQGGLLRGRVAPGSKVRLGEQWLRIAEDGRFVFGFGRDAGPVAMLTAHLPDGRTLRRGVEIGQRRYDIQRIDDLPQQQVSPPAELLERIQKEAALVRAARAIDSPRRDFEGGFVWPVVGPISGVYGSQRILNGEPRQPHYGVDVAVPEGTPVAAPAAGVVVLAEPDLYFSGGTLMLDHGHGVMSAFLHLSALEVELGQEVVQGERIARVGATGRVTGAHLDWRVNWFEERIDAQLLAPPMPQAVPVKKSQAIE